MCMLDFVCRGNDRDLIGRNVDRTELYPQEDCLGSSIVDFLEGKMVTCSSDVEGNRIVGEFSQSFPGHAGDGC